MGYGKKYLLSTDLFTFFYFFCSFFAFAFASLPIAYNLLPIFFRSPIQKGEKSKDGNGDDPGEENDTHESH